MTGIIAQVLVSKLESSVKRRHRSVWEFQLCHLYWLGTVKSNAAFFLSGIPLLHVIVPSDDFPSLQAMWSPFQDSLSVLHGLWAIHKIFFHLWSASSDPADCPCCNECSESCCAGGTLMLKRLMLRDDQSLIPTAMAQRDKQFPENP